MARETLDRVLERVEASRSISDKDRAELRQLLAELKQELDGTGDSDDARTLAGFTEVSTTAATAEQRDENALRIATDGMRASVGRFEQRHPKLVDLINQIATALSRMGI